jgi:(2S)-methylsuccinyl-CoA dehydrogenase
VRVRDGDSLARSTGDKTWITHRGARRPDDAAGAHRPGHAPATSGLSMLLGEKPRGTDADPFPVARA